MGGLDRVELPCGAVLKLILYGEWRELVSARFRGLPAIGPLACYDAHLVIFRPIDDISRYLGKSGGGRIKLTADGTPVLIPANAVAVVERCDDARELERDVSTILIVAVMTVARVLPLVGTM